ncbi:MAG: penicillin-binding protein 2 [Candidatus Kerfeldbacteria bacterium]|nr:penicillin-binding protein 2 [Candidatus Kerfeldbacteria bacterium]
MAIRSKRRQPADRTRVLGVIAGIFMAVVVVRLFSLQVLEHGFYDALAQGQHSLYEQLFPTRGKIFVTDKTGTALFPLATNEPLMLVYANPSKITGDREDIADKLAVILDMEADAIFERISKADDVYEPLKHGVRKPEVEKIRALQFAGIEFTEEEARFYPEGRYGSHVAGFLGFDGDKRKGQYGIEGAFDKELAGEVGHLQAERDATGRWIAIGSRSLVPARHGDNVVLTIDRAIQHAACTKLDAAVEKHGADGGSVVVINPTTGAILAMCGSPDFDPNDYSNVDDAAVYLNPAIFKQYEPGSVMKAITMAAAVDQGKVGPNTTYTDNGFVKYGSFTIKNSDGKAHGVQTMTQVLEESLNTGAIFAMQQIGPEKFAQYLDKFGFGSKTDVELQGEQAGDISALDLGKEIYAATGSYGQGITVTPLQLASAFGALANRGQLMKPYIVKELQHPDGTTTATAPTSLRQVVSPQTATTVSAMLVNVVRNGHGQRAGVPGYYVAGKTGTAQVPKQDGPGYEENVTIGSFAGYAPVEQPVFAMAVRIDRPRDVQFAESSAAPLFGEIADFILSYYGVVPTTSATPAE